MICHREPTFFSISNWTRVRFLIEIFFNWINKLWTKTNQLPQISTRYDNKFMWNFQENQTVAQIPSLFHSPHSILFFATPTETTHETRSERRREWSEQEIQTNGKIKQHVIVVYDWMEQHGFGDVELDTWRRLFWGFFNFFSLVSLLHIQFAHSKVLLCAVCRKANYRAMLWSFEEFASKQQHHIWN